MIPIGTWSFFHFFLLLICPLLGGILLYIFLGCFVGFISRKYKLKQKVVFFTRSMKLLLFVVILMNSWSLYLSYSFYQIVQEIAQKDENKAKRSRFIFDQDFQFDQQLFPKGTLINLYNVHDAGEDFRPLSLYGLQAAQFPRPMYIAGVWVDAYKEESAFVQLLQLAQDQVIAPVYMNDHKGGWVLDSTRKNIRCQKGQVAEFRVGDQYYPDKDYSKENWYAEEVITFKPALWKFVGCTTAAPILLEPAYQ